MVKIQQEIAKDKGYVLDGRDIGSVVLPNAELKVFQTASIESRAQRRLEEYQKKGVLAHYDDLLIEIKQRDDNDRLRSSSPLIKTWDAIDLDTSKLSIEEMVDIVYKEALKKLEDVQ
jgi:cytidylate kinase